MPDRSQMLSQILGMHSPVLSTCFSACEVCPFIFLSLHHDAHMSKVDALYSLSTCNPARLLLIFHITTLSISDSRRAPLLCCKGH